MSRTRHYSPLTLTSNQRALLDRWVRAAYDAAAGGVAERHRAAGPSANVMWTDNSSNEQGFAIERSADGTTFVQIATVGPNVNAYIDAGLRGNTNYHYRVRAYNEVGISGYSNTASVRTRNR
jgi:hypothetical protein